MQYGTLESACRKGGGTGARMKGANWVDIRSDRQKELSYTEIARKYNIDPKTAKKYAERETQPVYTMPSLLHVQ